MRFVWIFFTIFLQFIIRQNLIDEYNKDKEIFIFLITTKAGGINFDQILYFAIIK